PGRRGSTPGCPVGLPGYFTSARAHIRDPREREEKIGQPIEIDHHKGRDLNIALEGDDPPLGAPADGAGNVKERALARPAGDNERLEGLEFFFALVDGVLEVPDAPV